MAGLTPVSGVDPACPVTQRAARGPENPQPLFFSVTFKVRSHKWFIYHEHSRFGKNLRNVKLYLACFL